MLQIVTKMEASIQVKTKALTAWPWQGKPRSPVLDTLIQCCGTRGEQMHAESSVERPVPDGNIKLSAKEVIQSFKMVSLPWHHQREGKSQADQVWGPVAG